MASSSPLVWFENTSSTMAWQTVISTMFSILQISKMSCWHTISWRIFDVFLQLILNQAPYHTIKHARQYAFIASYVTTNRFGSKLRLCHLCGAAGVLIWWSAMRSGFNVLHPTMVVVNPVASVLLFLIVILSSFLVFTFNFPTTLPDMCQLFKLLWGNELVPCIGVTELSHSGTTFSHNNGDEPLVGSLSEREICSDEKLITYSYGGAAVKLHTCSPSNDWEGLIIIAII